MRILKSEGLEGGRAVGSPAWTAAISTSASRAESDNSTAIDQQFATGEPAAWLSP